MQERLWYNYKVIYIFCGEDTISARMAFNKKLDEYRVRSAEIISLTPSSIVDLKGGAGDNLSLFAQETIFCVENLDKFSFKKSTKTKTDIQYEAISSLAHDKNIIILDFEDGKQARQLKLRELAIIEESKPPISIFKLVEDCFPGNKNLFMQALKTVCSTLDEQFVFIMLYRHVRLLVLVQSNDPSLKLPPWQKYKIISQAKKWEPQRLMDYYSGLIKIEMTSKTSTNPYGVRKSLEILACHYL